MKKLVVLGMGVCMVLAFASCKSSESAYKKAYEKAKQQELAEPQVEAPVVKAKRLTLTGRFIPLFKAAAVIAIILSLGNVAQHSFSGDIRTDLSDACPWDLNVLLDIDIWVEFKSHISY